MKLIDTGKYICVHASLNVSRKTAIKIVGLAEIMRTELKLIEDHTNIGAGTSCKIGSLTVLRMRANGKLIYRLCISETQDYAI